MPYLLWRSLYGGVDVARRALHPALPIAPRLFDHHWRLPPGLPRVVMANTVSLLLLAQAFDRADLRDVALVFALLAAVTAVAFVKRACTALEDGDVDN